MVKSIGLNTNRFLTPDSIVPDPTNPQSFNRYSYAYNNPINFTDPTGHAPSNGCSYEGCDLPNFLPANDTWIDSSGTYYLHDPKFNPEPLDAFAGGISFSISANSPVASIEGNIALEEVVDLDSDRMTTFLVFGGDLSLGYEGFLGGMKELLSKKGARHLMDFGDANGLFSASVSMYGAAIHNVDEPVADYSDQFLYRTYTAAKGVGGMAGKAVAPQIDSNKPTVSSDVAGLVFGTGLTVNQGVSYYVPLFTMDPLHGDFDIHPQEAWNVISGFLSNTSGGN